MQLEVKVETPEMEKEASWRQGAVTGQRRSPRAGVPGKAAGSQHSMNPLRAWMQCQCVSTYLERTLKKSSNPPSRYTRRHRLRIWLLGQEQVSIYSSVEEDWNLYLWLNIGTFTCIFVGWWKIFIKIEYFLAKSSTKIFISSVTFARFLPSETYRSNCFLLMNNSVKLIVKIINK